MGFSKTFPRAVEGSAPKWEEVFLTEAEEQEQEKLSREDNIELLKECIDDAKDILVEKNLKLFQTNIVDLAISLFEKQASHSVYWKERKAKEKFDSKK